MKQVLRESIPKIVEALMPYQPEKVFLFGSSAWEKSSKDSDFDLLIVKRTRRSHFRRIPEARKYLYKIDGAFDILVMTPEEVKKRAVLGDFFIREILKKGKILYEKGK